MLPAHICHRCSHCVRGSWTCDRDGKSIAAHAQARQCPMGKFGKIEVATVGIAEKKATRTQELWAELHRQASPTDAWLASWQARIPCGDCRAEYAKIAADMPPDMSSPEAFFEWSVNLHNLVNAKLGRKEWSVDEARKRWRESAK